MLVIEGISWSELDIQKQSMWEGKTITEHMNIYMDQGLEKKEAMKAVAKDRGITKRKVYEALIDAKQK